MANEFNINSDELSREGYSNLATKTPDNKLDASRLDTPAAIEEARKLKDALDAKTSAIQGITSSDLDQLLHEAEKSNDSSQEEAAQSVDVPSSVRASADAARSQVKSVFKTPNEQYISNFKQALGKIPGYEPATLQDISDALYQSQDFTLRFIDWLEKEASSSALTLDTSGDPGLWPFTIEKVDFATSAEKQEYIKNMLDGLKHTFEGKEAGASMIEGTLLWILAGGATLGGVAVGTILALKAGKWVLVKSLGAAGMAIVGVLEGVTGKTLSVGKTAAVKAGVVGAKVLHSSTQKGNATPATTAVFQELDMAKPVEKIIHDGILRELYNQEVAVGTRPPLTSPLTDPIPQNFVDEVKNGIDPAKTAEYQSRVMKYQTLGNPPVGDAKKLQIWQSELERAIRGESDPAKWNLKAKSVIKANVGTNAAALSARLAQAHAASKTETIRISNDEFKIDPRAKAPLNEIKDFEVQIAEQEAKKAELEIAKKQLEARLADEKRYARATKYLEKANTEIQSKKTIWDDALTESEKQKTLYGESSTQYRTARTNAGIAEVEYTEELENKKTATTTKTSLELKYKNINRGLVIDTTGTLTDSTTMQKLDSTTVGKEGVKEKIKLANTEITKLEGEITTRMTTLNGFISGIPTAWRKAGITITMPDGSPERVTKLSELFSKLVKASVKK